MERYQEKESRSIVEESEEGLQTQLDEIFDTYHIQSMSDLMNNI